MRRRSRSTGYTLIEMVVVTAILSLLAALIMPNLVALQRSRVLRETQVALLRLPEEARNRARETKMPVVLRVDGDSLVIETDTESAESTESNVIGTSTDGFQRRVSFGNEVSVESAKQGEDSIDPGAFRWVVYPDGSAADAGIVFVIGPARKALYLPAEGRPRWIDGDLPDPTEERWPAGEAEQRVSS